MPNVDKVKSMNAKAAKEREGEEENAKSAHA